LTKFIECAILYLQVAWQFRWVVDVHCIQKETGTQKEGNYRWNIRLDLCSELNLFACQTWGLFPRSWPLKQPQTPIGEVQGWG